MEYILASASPRRKELLKLIVPEFSCIPADIEEIVPITLSVTAAPEYLAVQKAMHIASSHQNCLVIGSDTGVFIEDFMLGKPSDKNDAFKMLSLLSGRTHKVITGCALCYNGKTYGFSETTLVEFYELSNRDITDYIATNECMDKAGAYGIQGYGSTLVKSIHGDYFNVVGLPVARLKREIENFRCLYEQK